MSEVTPCILQVDRPSMMTVNDEYASGQGAISASRTKQQRRTCVSFDIAVVSPFAARRAACCTSRRSLLLSRVVPLSLSWTTEAAAELHETLQPLEANF